MTQADGQTLNYNVHVYPKNEVLSIEKDVTYAGNKYDSFDMQENRRGLSIRRFRVILH